MCVYIYIYIYIYIHMYICIVAVEQVFTPDPAVKAAALIGCGGSSGDM